MFVLLRSAAKIQCIKQIRHYWSLGLKEAKDAFEQGFNVVAEDAPYFYDKILKISKERGAEDLQINIGVTEYRTGYQCLIAPPFARDITAPASAPVGRHSTSVASSPSTSVEKIEAMTDRLIQHQQNTFNSFTRLDREIVSLKLDRDQQSVYIQTLIASVAALQDQVELLTAVNTHTPVNLNEEAF